MAVLEDEIDALYAVPLGDFVAARNALAKRAGTRAAEVKALPKPNAAAWSVNQLYWHQRAVFDALVKASQSRRQAVVKQLGGKDADASSADLKHRAAVEKALDAAMTFLRNAGDALTPVTTGAIRHTLEAVPSPDVNGRLIRPLESVGFGMLSQLMASAPGASTRAPAEVVVMTRSGRGATTAAPAKPAKPSKADEQAARRAEAERQKERARAVKEFDAAKAREREATAVFAKATRAIEQARARIAALEADVKAAREAVGDRQEEVDRARLALNDAAAERVTNERRMKALQDS